MLEFLKKKSINIGDISVNISKISVNIDKISVNIGYFDLNQIQQLELNHNGFFDNLMTILTPKNSINTSKIIQFLYKLIHRHISSI